MVAVASVFVVGGALLLVLSCAMLARSLFLFMQGAHWTLRPSIELKHRLRAISADVDQVKGA
jgi:hypothetical protein